MRPTLLAVASASAASAASAPFSILRLDRPVFSASPVTLNTSQFQFVIDESIPLLNDWDVVSVDLSYYGVRC
jgi:hypothetical protein